jgi:acyl transferase domain-containing protein
LKQAYISAITDPLSISIVGPVGILDSLKAQAEEVGLQATKVNIRGKIHNPENQALAAELSRLCEENPDLLRLPSAEELLVPVRSNSTGDLLSGVRSLTHEVVMSTLVSRCEWYKLLKAVSLQLKSGGPEDTTHLFAMFGTGRKNLLATAPFRDNDLKVRKLDVMTAVTAVAEKKPAEHLQSTARSPEPACRDAIAIVGAACRLPGANSLDELWDLTRAGRSMAQHIPSDRVNGKLSYRVGLDSSKANRHSNANEAGQQWYGNFIDDVSSFDNALFGISPREAQYMDPQQRLLLETAYQALDSSGYLRHHHREDFDNVGCFIGTTYTEYLENTTAHPTTAYSATGTIRTFQNGKISYHFGWSGPSEAIDTACSSSLVAIHRAFQAIRGGECPMALAGGVNIITGIQNYLDLGKAGFLNPNGQCKPFDQTADGYCRADGVGLVVLKALGRAVDDGDNILGVIPAVATNHGGLSQSITVPFSRAQISLFKTVLERSGLKARDISYVEAHGTGTQVR